MNRLRPASLQHKSVNLSYPFAAYSSVFILLIYHLMIGSSLTIILVNSCISALGIHNIFKKDIYFSNIYLFITSLYSGYLPLLIKALLWQPLQSNLYGGMDTHIYLLAGFLSLALAGMLIPHSRRENIFTRYFNNADFLKRNTLPFLVIGLIFHILHVILKPAVDQGQVEKTEGFGGFGSFYFLLLMAIVFQLKLYADNKNNAKYRSYIAITALTMFTLSVAANAKRDLLDFMYISVIAIYAFNIRIRASLILSGILCIAITTMYVSPVIHIMREGVTSVGLIERFHLFLDILSQNSYDYEKLARAESQYMSGFSLNYTPHGSYIFPSMLNIDRFMLVHPVDLVVRQMNYVRLMGIGDFVQSVLNGVLPSFLIQKTNAAGADLVAWHYGFRQVDSIARPVVGFTASAAAAWGFWGVVSLPWLVLLPLLTMADNLFGRLKNNAWCLTAVGMSSVLAERDIAATVVFFLREIPIVLVFSLVCIYIYQARPGGRAAAARR